MSETIAPIEIGTLTSWSSVRLRLWSTRFDDPAEKVLLASQFPSLHMVIDEAGAISRIRPEGDVAASAYHGPEPIAFLPARQKTALSMLGAGSVRIASIDLDPCDATMGDVAKIFSDQRIRNCVLLLAQDASEGGTRVGEGVCVALKAALADRLANADEPAPIELSPAQFDTSIAWLDRHGDLRGGIGELAAQFQLRANEFSGAFVRATGLSPQRWQLLSRIRRAQGLMLMQPELTLAEIAARFEFADQSHFSRQFGEIIGMPPSGWLRQRT